MSARNRELLALVPASLLVAAGFAAIFIQENARLDDLSLTYGAVFLGVCVATHLVVRFRLPYADPYLLPLAAVLACFGLVVIYRLDPEKAIRQAGWFAFGLLLFTLTIVFLKDFRVLERYRYTIAAAGLALLLLPRVPGIGQQVNGAYLGVGIGPFAFQPAEFGKLAIVIFLAAYLRDNRQLLVQGARRFAGVTIPPIKHFGPLLVVFLAADVPAVLHPGPRLVDHVLRRLPGDPLRGHEPLLVRAGRAPDVRRRRVGDVPPARHIQDRVEIWLDPFKPQLVEHSGYQIAQSLFAQADGGLFGTGFGAALLSVGGTSLLPAADTDLIYSVIVNELGLAGACGLLLVYLLFTERGMKVAMVASDSFSKLLAVGLTSVFALQVFVIVGGVTKVIPLTGVTLPFVSYGGSSIVANFVLLALLLLVSDRARRPAHLR